MWHTSEGDRILAGAEAKLFKAAVTSLVEYIKDEANCFGEVWSSCIPLFDDLTWSQKLAMLEFVATHLVTQTTNMPALTAVNEAAIGGIFEHVSYEIDLEVSDESAQTTWRKLVLDAYCECSIDDCTEDLQNIEIDTVPQSPEDNRQDLWHEAVQSLADRVLWDRDYEMMEDFLDEPPEKAAMLRQIMGIDDDYFVSIADDLNSPEAVTNALSRLNGLLKS